MSSNTLLNLYRVSKNVLYLKMQKFKNFYYNKDNRIWYFDLLSRLNLVQEET